MTLPKKSIIFETLNKTRHHTITNNQPTLFPELAIQNAPEDFPEFWYFSDLHNLYGNAYFPVEPNMNVFAWQNLVMPVPQKSKRATPQLKPTDILFYNEHVATIRHPYSLNNNAIRNAKDLKLSRYACWCLSRNRPSMIFSRTYFISPIINQYMKFEDMKQLSYQFARVHLRNQLSSYEKIIAGILKKYNANFRQFNHAMTRAFFYNYSANDLKEIHGIPLATNDPLANYMGAATLNARINALDCAIRKHNQTPNESLNKFQDTLYNELINARVSEIRNTSILPERDIFRTPVSKIQSQLARTERDFILQYSHNKTK